MNTLLTHFKNKSALAKVLGIKPQAVYVACARGRIPASWLPKLIKHGLTLSTLASMPLSKNGAAIISAMRNVE